VLHEEDTLIRYLLMVPFDIKQSMAWVITLFHITKNNLITSISLNVTSVSFLKNRSEFILPETENGDTTLF